MCWPGALPSLMLHVFTQLQILVSCFFSDCTADTNIMKNQQEIVYTFESKKFTVLIKYSGFAALNKIKFSIRNVLLFIIIWQEIYAA